MAASAQTVDLFGRVPLARLDLDARPLDQANHRPPKRAHVLLRELHAMENVAQVSPHAGLLGHRPEEAVLIEPRLEIVEEGKQHFALSGRRNRARNGRRRRSVAVRGLEPLVCAQEHGLGEIERGVGGIGRKGDDRAGQRHLVVVEARALRPEQDAALLARAAAVAAMATLGLRTAFICPRSRAVVA